MFVEFDNNTLDDISFLELAVKFFPWVVLEGLDGERNFAVFDVDNLCLDLVTNFVELARVFYKTPIKFTDVNETFETFLNFEEYSEVNDSCNCCFEFIAERIFANDCLTLIC